MNKLYSLGFILGRTSFKLTNIFETHFMKKNINLSPSEFILLRSLFEDGNMTKKQLSQFVCESKMDLDDLLLHLKDRKFIEQDDSQISITSEGLAIIRGAIECADDITDKILSTIDEQDIALLSELLEEIYKNANDLK